ncbi:ubiquinol-cytochrome C chaperone family protein [Rhodopseudomonas palustris]|uniref:ubiquinol-cytochrome C chaperone family protein n=1 Tax=Rhodopseudomonas palustris TaxID=1076 RepID=UPI002ACD254B|nr:ubiquinol-cytochrome C chaperone family protein [Rhodopseudomonas palustris]WQH00933.1 ubiquinol-cytochrome C chaperone family protein [Rhodopseudomonas palustris]
MIWPFNHLRPPRTPPRRTIEAIYGMIVAQAREPAFYQQYGVSDTVNGRFEMIVVHLWLVLRRIRAIPDSATFAQALFDCFCSDLDANLRELGVGDLTVPKRMQAFGEAFYGRSAAYDLALTEGDEALAMTLDRNVLYGADIGNGRRLAAYVGQVIETLDGIAPSKLRNGELRFPAPPAA